MIYHVYNTITKEFICSREYATQPSNSTTVAPLAGFGKNQIWNDTEWVATKTIEDVAVEFEALKYEQRISDGIKAVAKLSAELRLAKQGGQIDETTQNAIDDILKPVRDEILAGQWEKAKVVLVGIGSTNIGQTLYDTIYGRINDYILANY